MKTIKLFTILLVTFFIAACSGIAHIKNSGVKLPAKKYTFNDINITLSKSAKKMLAKNKLFNKDIMRKSVLFALKKEKLINKNSANTLHINITKIKTRSNFVAIVLAIVGTDKISAEVTVEDRAGHIKEKFKLNSTFSLGGTLTGHSAVRLRFLYYNIGIIISNVFTGNDKLTDF